MHSLSQNLSEKKGIHYNTHIHTHKQCKHTNIQHTNMQTHKHIRTKKKTQRYKHINIQRYKYTNTPTYKHTKHKTYKYINT